MITYKTEEGLAYIRRLTDEFNQQLDPLCRALVADLSIEMEKRFNRDIILTCVGRTPEENAKDGGVPNSAHLTFRAVDIRAKDWKPEEREFALAWIRHRWAQVGYALIHNAGGGIHLHVNINWAFARQTFE